MENNHSNSPSWLSDLERQIQRENSEFQSPVQPCIFRAPRSIRKGADEEYEPRVVSLGPYHHGKQHLMAFEAHKWRALAHCARRSKKDINQLVKIVEKEVSDLMKCYDNLDDQKWSKTEDFVKLMVMDGCFMLEIIRLAFIHKINRHEPIFNQPNKKNDYPSYDPVFSQHGLAYNMRDVQKDMMLLENQLPLQLLKLLFNVLDFSDDWRIWEIEATTFIYSNMGFKSVLRAAPKDIFHHLDYVYRCMDVHFPRVLSSQKYNSSPTMRTTIELSNAGAELQRSRDNIIKFYKGTLTVPRTVVDDTTKRKLFNLIAYERLRCTGAVVNAYVIFMANLMKKPEDVTLLCAVGILENNLGSPEQVVELYSAISDGLVDSGGHLECIHGMINEFCDTKWRRCRAYLKRTYFRSPWALFSLVYALVLFLFTVAQTYYAIAAYYAPKEESLPK
ncbi:hypothetical protein IHE45_14G090700 [Dioscorea alata]|uniref:Uncharacterized protein n=1 Tax=Dioscorea alata TaxID=55571 RepID=A0ACB7UTA8_DIOAL|nr:hypothetical protein IHE45_14G090700 [Dioscorea alata]